MGSKVLIWKQDPSVPFQGVRATFIGTEVRPGPSDDELRVEMPGKRAVEPWRSGDFLFDRREEPEKFDAVHTFAVARQVLTMYQRALRRLSYDAPFQWQWGAAPLTLKPRATPDNSSPIYNRIGRSISFTYYPWEDKRGKTITVFTCQSFDMIAHEMGHAILDALKPGYYNPPPGQVRALSEAFADLAAIFTVLAQMDQVETIIVESKADLQNTTFLSAIAEQYGLTRNVKLGFRNALNKFKADQTFGTWHEMSQVFTGAVYDVLSEVFETEKNLAIYDPAEVLFRSGRHVLDLVLSAFLDGPAENATFRDIAEKMVSNESNRAWRGAFTRVFELRKIF